MQVSIRGVNGRLILKTISYPPLRWDRVNLSQHIDINILQHQDADMCVLGFLSNLASIGFVQRECRRRAFSALLHTNRSLFVGIKGKI